MKIKNTKIFKGIAVLATSTVISVVGAGCGEENIREYDGTDRHLIINYADQPVIICECDGFDIEVDAVDKEHNKKAVKYWVYDKNDDNKLIENGYASTYDIYNSDNHTIEKEDKLIKEKGAMVYKKVNK